MKPLANIHNLIFPIGRFPSKIETAQVFPISKSVDRDQFSINWPISLLPKFLKNLEKPFVQRLDNFIEKHNSLSDHQALEQIGPPRWQWCNCRYLFQWTTVPAFVDYQKAFNTIIPSLPMKKLERDGIRVTAYTWLRSYLDGRYPH